MKMLKSVDGKIRMYGLLSSVRESANGREMLRYLAVVMRIRNNIWRASRLNEDA